MEKVRLAVVGLGLRGTGLVKSVFTENKRCEIVAICDLYRDRIDAIAEVVKTKINKEVPIRTTDFNELLTKKEQIDAIL